MTVQIGVKRTVELLVALDNAGRAGRMACLLIRGGLLVHVAYGVVNGASYESSKSNIRRTKVVVKVRRAMARGAARLAAAKAERCRNMARAIGVERRVLGWWLEVVVR
jgi:hypothetical protein